MDYTDTQKTHLQKVAYKHHAGTGNVYGGASATCALECGETSFIGIAATESAR